MFYYLTLSISHPVINILQMSLNNKFNILLRLSKVSSALQLPILLFVKVTQFFNLNVYNISKVSIDLFLKFFLWKIKHLYSLRFNDVFFKREIFLITTSIELRYLLFPFKPQKFFGHCLFIVSLFVLKQKPSNGFNIKSTQETLFLKDSCRRLSCMHVKSEVAVSRRNNHLLYHSFHF